MLGGSTSLVVKLHQIVIVVNSCVWIHFTEAIIAAQTDNTFGSSLMHSAAGSMYN